MSARNGLTLMGEIEAEIHRQDEMHGGGYGSTRDGVRLGLVSIEDELREARQEWDREKHGGGGGWSGTYEELLQAVAVGFRLLRDLQAVR